MITLQTTWVWPVAIYLFLGGLSGGLFFFSGVACLGRQRRFRKVYRRGFLCAACLLSVGLLCLLFELVKPAQALMVWTSFSHESSWMTWGAWAAFSCVILFTLCGVFECPKPARWLSDICGDIPYLRERLKTVAVSLGMAGGLFITVYTGMLLYNAVGIPFWHSPLLPALFCVSALNAGLSLFTALLFIGGRATQLSRRQKRGITVVVIVLMVIQGALLFLYVYSMAKGGGCAFETQRVAAAVSVNVLVRGQYAVPFWVLVVALGLIVPLALSGFSLFHSNLHSGLILAITICGILGDAALRFLVLMAGSYPDWFAGPLLALL